jgi:hypothetical protein
MQSKSKLNNGAMWDGSIKDLGLEGINLISTHWVNRNYTWFGNDVLTKNLKASYVYVYELYQLYCCEFDDKITPIKEIDVWSNWIKQPKQYYDRDDDQ